MDISRLTLGEVAKIEELSGQPISRLGEEDAPKGAVLAALAFVAKRRENPKFTWNDAQALTFDEANAILNLTSDDDAGEEPDPTEGDDAPTPSPRTRAKKSAATD